MIKNHVVMIINAFVLIALGVYGYITSGSPTALIAPGIGVILLALSIPTKNENHTMAHIGVALTLISAVTFIIIGIRRGNAMVIGIGVFTFICFDAYVLNFILRKKQREAAGK
ncbi:MAG: hypothetical protein IT281_09575 [Ignavibacteria bacterium]|nr:hypothetical protein [Ignavibacteria bacterium]MCC7159776.1 hypothetical protein [Ignavibacteria bacterium]